MGKLNDQQLLQVLKNQKNDLDLTKNRDDIVLIDSFAKVLSYEKRPKNLEIVRGILNSFVKEKSTQTRISKRYDFVYESPNDLFVDLILIPVEVKRIVKDLANTYTRTQTF